MKVQAPESYLETIRVMNAQGHDYETIAAVCPGVTAGVVRRIVEYWKTLEQREIIASSEAAEAEAMVTAVKDATSTAT